METHYGAWEPWRPSDSQKQTPFNACMREGVGPVRGCYLYRGLSFFVPMTSHACVCQCHAVSVACSSAILGGCDNEVQNASPSQRQGTESSSEGSSQASMSEKPIQVGLSAILLLALSHLYPTAHS
eukprot:6478251-Amphidinium_carterae.3